MKRAGVIDVEADPRYEPERAGDIRHSLADVSEARRTLGFDIRVPFDEGLQRTVAALVGNAALV